MKICQILDFSTFPNSGSRCPIWLFKVTFGILISSPSLLEHVQALSSSNKRTIRGGGRGTSIGNLDIFGFCQMLLRHLWKGPWWFWSIEKWSVMLHLVVWECLGLTLVDMKHLPFDRFATDGQNPTFTFAWYNDRNNWGPTLALGHVWVIWSHLLAQNSLSMCCVKKLSLQDLGRSWSITTEPPNSDLAEWKSAKSWIFQHFLTRVLDVRFDFSRWLLESSSRARHSWSISKHFLGLINVPYGVAEMVRIGNLEFFGFLQMLLRHLWKGPWWFWLIEKWSVMLHLVVWECLGMTLVDMKHLPFDRLATERQNPTFTFLWDNDRISSGPLFALGHLCRYGSHLLAQNTLSMYRLTKISSKAVRESCSITTDPPTTPLGWVKNRPNLGLFNRS